MRKSCNRGSTIESKFKMSLYILLLVLLEIGIPNMIQFQLSSLQCTTNAFTIVRNYPQQQYLPIITRTTTTTATNKRTGLIQQPVFQSSSRSKCSTTSGSSICYALVNNNQQETTKTLSSKRNQRRTTNEHQSQNNMQQQQQQQQQRIESRLLISKVISNKKQKHTTTSSLSLSAMQLKKKIAIADRKKKTTITTTDIETTTNDMNTLEKLLLPFGLVCIIGLAVSIGSILGISTTDITNGLQQLQSNPQQTLQNFIVYVETIGPLAPIVYGIFYFIAELLAVPATPLTMSSGYLFGLLQGFFIVWIAGVSAASITFFIGRTLLRSYVENTVLIQNKQLAKIDTAISNGTNGFKIILLLRLSPLFPFALSNYVYGATSVDFGSYVAATGLGFIPGTLALVVTGMLGKELTLGGNNSLSGDTSSHQPWYVYAIGLGVIVTFLKLITDVATDLINAVADDDDNDNDNEIK